MVGHGAASPGIHVLDFKRLVAFVQNLERMLKDFAFLNFLEIKGSLGENHRRSGRGLSLGKRQKSKTKQKTQ
jgi:hypothetical protein